MAARVSAVDRTDAELSEQAEQTERCERELSRVLRVEALPGAPVLQANRVEILGRAKATPVLFVDVPQYEPSDDPRAAALRQRLEELRAPYRIGRLLGELRGDKALARAVLLRDGYLYAERPITGAALARHVELTHLFDEEQIVIQRGSQQLVATKVGREYRYDNGDEAGKPAHILLFDRVWVKGEPPKAPLHLDVAAVADHLGFERMRVQRLTDENVVAELRYAEHWVPTLLRRDGSALHLECEKIEPELQAAVSFARKLAARRRQTLAAVWRAIDQQVDESLPFDEPKTEDGQQDGHLRPEWRRAYRQGKSFYEFNEDRYYVFDSQGRPRVPQVCIDFITDTLERAAGTWWLTRGEKRQRVMGRLNIRALEIDNQRSVERFIEFAWRNPQMFEVFPIPREERIPFYRRGAFFAHLAEHADRYLPGDIIAILGLRDDEKLHYHSFFVREADPVTGMPMLLAANAGRPRIRTWEGEMQSAPRRSLQSRIRPRLEWLESIVVDDWTVASDPEPRRPAGGAAPAKISAQSG